jgi:hypothetical protein
MSTDAVRRAAADGIGTHIRETTTLELRVILSI